MSKLSEHDQMVVNNILSGLKGSLQSCEHQAKCIEVETQSEEPGEDYSEQELGLGSMWDCNDLDNWTSMADNIRQAITFLSQLK